MKIGALYGCFPDQIWNGGRDISTPRRMGVEINNIINTIKELNEVYEIPLRFTYTNGLLKEEHFSDLYCNFVTDVANNGMNEILVNNEEFEKFIRNKYPNFKYISSATRCIRDLDKLNELIDSGKYYLVLGDYRDNFNFDLLSKINNKSKLEILINPYCSPDCKVRELHYHLLNRITLGLELDHDIPKCLTNGMHWQELLEAGHVIKVEDLQKYIDMGFSNFKIEGRVVKVIDVIDSYVYYLIKPEYVDLIRNKLLRAHYLTN